MFLEHLADITIYDMKSPVQSTTVGSSSPVQADLNWFTLYRSFMCYSEQTHGPL